MKSYKPLFARTHWLDILNLPFQPLECGCSTIYSVPLVKADLNQDACIRAHPVQTSIHGDIQGIVIGDQLSYKYLRSTRNKYLIKISERIYYDWLITWHYLTTHVTQTSTRSHQPTEVTPKNN